MRDLLEYKLLEDSFVP